MRKLFIIISVAVAIILSVLLCVRLYIQDTFSKQDLKGQLTSVVQDNFNKAVRFDSIQLKAWGDIVITNLKISASDDFNDNVSIIDAPEVIINIRLIPLLKGKISIKNIEFQSAAINVQKRFDSTYQDAVSGFSNIHRLFRQSSELSSRQVKIKIVNSRFTFSELFQNDIFSIELYDANADISMTTEHVSWNLSANIDEQYSGTSNTPQFLTEGEYYALEDEVSTGSVQISLDALSLELFNPYLRYKLLKVYEIDGKLNGRAKISFYNDTYSLNLGLEGIGLSLESVSRHFNRKRYISDLDCSFETRADRISPGHWEIHRVQLKSGDNELLADGEFNNTEELNTLAFNVQSSIIDLSTLSGNIYPFGRSMELAGTMRTRGAFLYNIKDHINMYTLADVSMSGISVILTEDARSREIFSNLDGDIRFTEKSLDASFSGKSEKSDLALRVESSIARWNPFSSESRVRINSDYFSGKKLADLFMIFHDYVDEKAKSNSLKGYTGVLFPEQKYGEFLINNDIHFDGRIAKLGIGGDAALNNVRLVQVLKERELDTQLFEASGYEGAYSFRLRGNLKNDIVRFTTKAAVNDLNLAYWFRDTGFEGTVGGIFDMDYSWSVDGYRLKHLIFQATSEFSGSLSDGVLSDTAVNKRYSDFLEDCGSSRVDSLSYDRISFGMRRASVNYYVRPLVIQSDEVQCNARGVYLYNKGLNIPLTATIIQESDGSRNRETARLRISGRYDELRIHCRDNEEIQMSIF